MTRLCVFLCFSLFYFTFFYSEISFKLKPWSFKLTWHFWAQAYYLVWCIFFPKFTVYKPFWSSKNLSYRTPIKGTDISLSTNNTNNRRIVIIDVSDFSEKKETNANNIPNIPMVCKYLIYFKTTYDLGVVVIKWNQLWEELKRKFNWYEYKLELLFMKQKKKIVNRSQLTSDHGCSSIF